MTLLNREEAVAFARNHQYKLLIGGKLCTAIDGSTMESIDPSTGKVITSVPKAGPQDVMKAVEAAKSAQPAWGALSIRERRTYYQALADAIAPHRDALAVLDAVDSGNPLNAMVKDVDYVFAQLSDWPALAMSLAGQTLPVTAEGLHYTAYRPYGVVGRIVPFNHPALFAICGFGAALMAGNTMVLKVADQTPLSALYLGEIINKILPPGVLNILSGGPDVGDAIVTHPVIKRVGFTGSGAVGQLIQQRAASVGVKHVSLELGGKNPLIVFPDADLDKAVAGAIHGMNFGVCQGQSCGSNSRILIHSSVHDDFVERMRSAIESIVVGRAYDPGTQMGPLVSRKQYDRVLGYIDQGKASGAKLVTGGSRPSHLDEQGYFIAPTVFSNVDMSMSIAKEEIFGPVVSVSSWNDYDMMLQQANDVEYGLTASIWSEDISLALKTAERIEAGYIWVNDANRHYWGVPFGGMKNSGLGREESMHELLSYMELQAINVIMKDPRTRLAEMTGNEP
ncbi:MAG: aldehyde dehydrogenase family protein [Actinobacteria bacterium]|uniref:Unannotated protein n=1 Tax=freshwater metagenome TaxID=449393 RepID=A0A6J6UXK7_9ZZZZ|nr:aldehyde dehydrogenase family protein [Actinomycetota bacterium]MSY26448.1 aldehyde dehydrogenase family protein [Actinomycetota bacterium]MSZ86087.1 aldehyde dehydrogenase family protein [Actinomycetota bacterium]MTB13521.1 aldehyde dehydrogenase family protein [Actinomycetota bacterium]MTB24335.1 aldehyde dehydrogenase family protein [Actinomycetota bacterium]